MNGYPDRQASSSAAANREAEATPRAPRTRGPLPRSPGSRREFPGTPQCVADVRRYLGRELPAAGCAGVVDEAVLLASELATNAVVHTRSGDPLGSFSVELAITGRTVRVLVHDLGSRRIPQVLGGTDSGGRGLWLVHALADDWGTSSDATGRTVWFELALPDDSRAEPRSGPPPTA
ncbi:ATP-binding protein [Streptomyces sp. H27-D2]|uniref:ATP-binding protein n=1 Tax=Streptomyces sp. H27-D2 TaxID=3046304 RepID=UPI002DC000F1|nr:ATP-binding protein [Streptomyces sp. H27-D2]MEC4018559.1 ATP-binding protein [Streptomyces sp. H27-D2]